MEDRMRSVIDSIYEAAFRPDAWLSVMGGISAIFDCIGATLDPDDLAGRRSLPATPSLEDFVETYFRDGWQRSDVRRQRAVKHRREAIVLDQDLVTPDEMDTIPFYQELLLPFGLRYCACLRFGNGRHAWSLSLQRGARAEPFGPDEIGLMRRLAPHIRKAGRTATTLAMKHDEGILDGLQSLDAAAALIDRDGRVLSHTPHFERFVGEGLQLRRGRLTTNHSDQNRRLSALMEQALATGASQGEGASARLQITRADLKGTFIVDVIPLRRSAADIFAHAAALLTVVDPAEPLRLAEEILAQDYALTPTEIRLAGQLAAGTGLCSAATALGMSYETARTHLKQIFSKLDVHKQSEMVAQIRGLSRRGI